MKRTTLYSLVAILLISGTGCKKFLDKEPENRAQLNSVQKVSQLLGSAYPKANYQPMAEISSDNSGDVGSDESDQPDFTILNSDLYFFDDNKGTANNEDTPEGYWYGCYKAIGCANTALEAINKATNPSDYKAQKGEALVARAYAHFMLVNFFARFYDPATASSDQGIPYVLEPEKVSIKQYERKTVQYVYDMIEKDLLEGLPLIDDNSYNVPKFHFNVAAANAFASRFYLYKKDYANVIKYATASIPENSFSNNLRPWNTVYTDLPLNGNGSLGQIYTKGSEKANLLVVETLSYWLRLLAYCRYNPTSEVVDAARGEIPVSGAPSWGFPFVHFSDNGHDFLPKVDEYFVETSIGSGYGDGYAAVTLFSVEEVLFNLAEAYTYTGQTDKAINLLNVYLSTRIPLDDLSPDYDVTEQKVKTYYGTSDLQLGMINTILDYRKVEFIHEGLRWFDILRYGIEYTHETNDNFRSVTLTKNNPHRVFQIPPVAAQSGIGPNPR